MTAFISYLRVSTEQQGASGLGLEAQRATVAEYVLKQGGPLLTEFAEVERGKRFDRPQLAKALAAAEKRSAVLRSKADRHAENIGPIIDAIREAGVTTLTAIATALNARGIATARGGQWHASSVRNVKQRLEKLQAGVTAQVAA